MLPEGGQRISFSMASGKCSNSCLHGNLSNIREYSQSAVEIEACSFSLAVEIFTRKGLRISNEKEKTTVLTAKIEQVLYLPPHIFFNFTC